MTTGGGGILSEREGLCETVPCEFFLRGAPRAHIPTLRHCRLIFRAQHSNIPTLLPLLCRQIFFLPLTTMAWRCSGSSNSELVNNLRDNGIVKTADVHAAMLKVDRGNFSPCDFYEDSPQPIGYDATISAPHMHAHALEELYPALRDGGKVLDVGCGSGYLLACFGRLDPTLEVFGIDVVSELVDMSRDNLQKSDGDLLVNGRIKLDVRDGWKGWAENGPFNVIHVGAAAASVPEALLHQLKVGGVMIIPVGPDGGNQELLKIVRESEGDEFLQKSLMGVRYVPLVKR